jgi:hypothetical protein
MASQPLASRLHPTERVRSGQPLFVCRINGFGVFGVEVAAEFDDVGNRIAVTSSAPQEEGRFVDKAGFTIVETKALAQRVRKDHSAALRKESWSQWSSS